MNRLLVTISVAIAFTAQITAAQPSSPAPRTEQAPPDTIIYETTSWGRLTYHLELHSDGRLRAWQVDFHSGERSAEREEQRGPAIYQRAIAALAPLSSPPTLDCTRAPTDAPGGRYFWHGSGAQQSFGIYYGCYAMSPLPPANQLARDAEERFFGLVAPATSAAPP